MTKNIIKGNLDRFDYNYSDQGDKFVVKLGYSLQMTIDLTNPDKVLMKDRLKSWNFLTGSFEMSVNGSMIYSFISSFFAALMVILIRDRIDHFIITVIILIAVFWNLLWALYYFTKSENFKQQVINWAKK